MNVIAIIPARMSSSRYPGKPLVGIHGMPMIGHCYHRTRMCRELSGTYVATCDEVIRDYVESIGGEAVMTADTHRGATDRIAEAMLKLEQDLGEKVDVVVMVQGDEPMVTPEMISLSLGPFSTDETVNVVNLMAPLGSVAEFEDPNEVKVVVDRNGDALYFSREPIPSRKKGSREVTMLKQVCIIPFRRDYLLRFNGTPESDLERFESVDMMRILENGDKIRMVLTDAHSYSVDTEEDRLRVERSMADDELMQQYLKS